MEFGTELQVEPEFQSVRRVKHVKSHFQYEAHDQSTTQEEI
jgi:hypothetical protein